MFSLTKCYRDRRDLELIAACHTAWTDFEARSSALALLQTVLNVSALVSLDFEVCGKTTEQRTSENASFRARFN
jgi:hypothetical protein